MKIDIQFELDDPVIIVEKFINTNGKPAWRSVVSNFSYEHIEAALKSLVFYDIRDAMKMCYKLNQPCDPQYEKTLLDHIENMQYHDISLKDLKFSTRTYNCLFRHGCLNLYDILNIPTKDELYNIRNIGIKSAEEVINVVHSFGLKMSWEEEQ